MTDAPGPASGHPPQPKPNREPAPRRALASGHQLTADIAPAQRGDEQAYRRLFRATQPRLLNYARALVGEADAEDVTAETWACIARDLHRFRGDGQGFLGWAATITHHRATDHLRRRQSATPLAHEHLPEHTSPHDTPGQAEETISTQRALATIGRLPRDQAQAILLRVIMGLDAASAAEILGKRPGAVRTAAHRGLRTLESQIRAEDHRQPTDNETEPEQAAPQPAPRCVPEPARKLTARRIPPKPAEC